MVIVTSAAIACGLEAARHRQAPARHAELAGGGVGGAERALDGLRRGVRRPRTSLTSTVLLTRRDTADRQAYLHARDTLDRLLDLGVVPIVNENDTVSVRADPLRRQRHARRRSSHAWWKPISWSSSRTSRGSSTANPHFNPEAKLIGRVEAIGPEIMAVAGGAGTTVGSGGMITKIKAARVLMVAGIPMVVCNGRRPGLPSLRPPRAARHVGTPLTSPQASPTRSRPKKLWIALGDAARGAARGRRRRQGGARSMPRGARFCRWA